MDVDDPLGEGAVDVGDGEFRLGIGREGHGKSFAPRASVRKGFGGHGFGSPFGTRNVWPGKIRFGSRIWFAFAEKIIA